MSDDPTTEMLAEIDRDLADIEKAVSALQQQAAQANYPQRVETTTDRLAEIEGQAADYTPPKGWRKLQPGEVLQPGDAWAHPQANVFETDLNMTGVAGSQGHYLRRQVCEGRWCTRGGKEISVTAMPTDHTMYLPGYPWWDGDVETWKNDGGYYKNGEALEDLVKYLGPIEPEPEQTITPDDVAAEALAGVNDSAVVANPFQTIRELLQRNNKLATQGSQQHMQIQELRSEVSYVQGLLGESSRRVVELETLVKDLRNINATAERSVEAAARDKADLEHRLDTVAAEWAQQVETSRRLQIKLDAREQVPQAVSDRFEEGWDKGTAQAVETIAEWTEPFRQMIEKADNLVESDRASRLCAEIMQSLPAIMRSLTGLVDED